MTPSQPSNQLTVLNGRLAVVMTDGDTRFLNFDGYTIPASFDSSYIGRVNCPTKSFDSVDDVPVSVQMFDNIESVSGNSVEASIVEVERDDEILYISLNYSGFEFSTAWVLDYRLAEITVPIVPLPIVTSSFLLERVNGDDGESYQTLVSLINGKPVILVGDGGELLTSPSESANYVLAYDGGFDSCEHFDQPVTLYALNRVYPAEGFFEVFKVKAISCAIDNSVYDMEAEAYVSVDDVDYPIGKVSVIGHRNSLRVTPIHS